MSALQDDVRVLARRELPRLLAAIHDPPPRLHVRGAAPLDLLEGRLVAVVGARACSAYGTTVARALARSLAEAGAVVVSGLARGIDAAAHRGALDAGAPTIAVLGCGIDRDYPAAHAELARQIRATGLVISEYGPGVEPAPWRFPARNRIIAGLCAATIVVEARARSGALITADFALEEGREVMSVPGEITSALSQGTNQLIRIGAMPLTSVTEAIELLGFEPASSQGEALPEPARELLEQVREAPGDVDRLARALRRSAADVATGLVELELAGLVINVEGVYRVAA
jgi:DNA processing protein